MKIKLRGRGKLLAGAGLLLLVALVVGVSLAPDLGANAAGASPAALKRIDQKNDRAAADASARMRSESRTTTEAADRRLAAEERGRVQAEATIARFQNDETGLDNRAATAEQ